MKWTIRILVCLLTVLCGIVAIELGMLLVYSHLPHLSRLG